MENCKPNSSDVSGAPPLCAISGVGTASAPPPRGTSSRLTFVQPPRGITGPGITSAPPPRGVTGGKRPPRPNTPLTAKIRRQPFQCTGGILPRHFPDVVLVPSGVVSRHFPDEDASRVVKFEEDCTEGYTGLLVQMVLMFTMHLFCQVSEKLQEHMSGLCKIVHFIQKCFSFA
jgi:hypothetical protein